MYVVAAIQLLYSTMFKEMIPQIEKVIDKQINNRFLTKEFICFDFTQSLSIYWVF